MLRKVFRQLRNKLILDQDLLYTRLAELNNSILENRIQFDEKIIKAPDAISTIPLFAYWTSLKIPAFFTHFKCGQRILLDPRDPYITVHF